MKIYVAREFMWINPINSIYVFKGQMFMCKPNDLPMPTLGNWEEFYECIFIQQ